MLWVGGCSLELELTTLTSIERNKAIILVRVSKSSTVAVEAG